MVGLSVFLNAYITIKCRTLEETIHISGRFLILNAMTTAGDTNDVWSGPDSNTCLLIANYHDTYVYLCILTGKDEWIIIKPAYNAHCGVHNARTILI